MVERLVRNEEVRGSIPLGSTSQSAANLSLSPAAGARRYLLDPLSRDPGFDRVGPNWIVT